LSPYRLIAENFLSSSPQLTTLDTFLLKAMAEAKFKPTEKSVGRLIGEAPDEKVRDDCYELVRIMKKVTGAEPVIWAPNIIGFGKYHYVYDSGHEGDACLTGFAVRKQNITLYFMPPAMPQWDDLLKKLGKHRASKGCIYIKKLDDIDTNVLEEMIAKSVSYLKKKYAS
jgi:hypothetical protein